MPGGRAGYTASAYMSRRASSASAESVAAVTVAEAGEELAVGHLRQVHHEVFAVVSEEVVNDGGVLAGVEGAEVFVIVVTNRVHEGLLWLLGGVGENASLFSITKGTRHP